MNRNPFIEAASELGLGNDPTILALSRLLYAQDRAFERHVEEQIAHESRVCAQLNRVPVMRLVKVED